MNRREFLKASAVLSFLIVKSKAASLFSEIQTSAEKIKNQINEIILSLRKEGSNIVKKIMNGRKYKYYPYTHYPVEGGIKDEVSGYQLFFHAHRPNEYGHFHTFATDDEGNLIHLLLISMDKDGIPIGLATVNRWVTGDTYVNADVLKKLAEKFFIDPSLFQDKKIIEFINLIFKLYKEEIFNLFDERDEWIRNYVNTNFREPFEDREFEILSYKKINL